MKMSERCRRWRSSRRAEVAGLDAGNWPAVDADTAGHAAGRGADLRAGLGADQDEVVEDACTGDAALRTADVVA